MSNPTHLIEIKKAIINYAKNEAHIDGIKSYEAFLPVKIDTAEMPIMFVTVGPATYGESNTNYANEERIFRIQVAVTTTSEGLNENIDQLATDILEASINAFIRLASLNVDWVQEILVEEDTGVAIMEGYRNDLIGFEIPLRIKYIRQFTLVDIQN